MLNWMQSWVKAGLLVGTLSMFTVGIAQATPGGGDPNRKCHYSVRLKTLKVNDNSSGMSDSTLELTVKQEASAGGKRAEKSHDFADKIREGETHEFRASNSVLSPYFSHVADEDSSVSIELKTTVIERDKGLNGKDDTGSKSGTATFTCSDRGTKNVDTVVSVLKGGTGKEVAKITVTSEIKWGE